VERVKRSSSREPRPPIPKFMCPKPGCGSFRSHVVRGDTHGDLYRRRRKCDVCGTRFNTAERVEIFSDRNI